MSIKLYEGFKLEGVSTIEDALSFIESIRPKIKERILEKTALEIKTLACLMYDLENFETTMFTEEEDRKPLLAATLRLKKDSYETETEFSIALTSVDGQILGYPFFPERGYIDILWDHPQVKQFGYWDNSDPEEDVTEKEWNERKRLWNLALSKEDIFNRAMFVIVLADKRHMLPRDDQMEELPTLEDREHCVASQLAWAEATETVYDANTNNLGETIVKSNKLKKKYLDIVKGKLKTDITIRTLEQPLPIKENNNGS